MTTQINALATKIDNWWIAEFTIDGHEYGTQAKQFHQLEAMIKDAFNLLTGLPQTECLINISINVNQ